MSPAVARLGFDEPTVNPELDERDLLLEHVDTLEDAVHLALRALRAIRQRVVLRPDLTQRFDPTRLQVALADLERVASNDGALVARLRDLLTDET